MVISPLLIKKSIKMKNLTWIIVLLFTISTLASCNDSSKKTIDQTNKDSKIEQKSPTIKRVDAKAFKAEIDSKKVQLVDVRTPGEFAKGHIKDATNVNVLDNSFITKMAKFDKSQPIYVYCRSGGRSMRAAAKLTSAGFNVVNLNGGIIGWSRNGYKFLK